MKDAVARIKAENVANKTRVEDIDILLHHLEKLTEGYRRARALTNDLSVTVRQVRADLEKERTLARRRAVRPSQKKRKADEEAELAPLSDAPGGASTAGTNGHQPIGYGIPWGMSDFM